MQIRCTYCQNMFALSRDETLAALEHMEEHKLIYYDAHCPRCRRANRVEKNRLERSFPDWQKVLKTMEKNSAKAEEAAQKPAPAVPLVTKAAKKVPSGAGKKQPVKTAAQPVKKAPGKPAAKTLKKPLKKQPEASARKPVQKTAVKPAGKKK